MGVGVSDTVGSLVMERDRHNVATSGTAALVRQTRQSVG